MTSTPGATVRRGSRGLVALLAVLSMLAVSLGVTSAVAAVAKPTLSNDAGSPSALQVSWSASDAKSFSVQYSTSATFASGVVTLPASGQPAITDNKTSITGLAIGQTYYVRVAGVDAQGKVGSYTSASAAAPKYAYAAPGDLFRTKVTNKSMTVRWAGVKGAPGYTLRVYAKGSATRYVGTTQPTVNLTGLKASTTYYLRAYVNRGATVLSPTSPEVLTATSGYSRAAPDGFRQTSQSAYTVGLAWTGVIGAPADGGYRVSYALDAAQTDHPKTTGTFKATTGALTKLNGDTTYFAKIYVVDKGGRRLSLSSDFIVAKSLVPRGRLSGEIAGVTGSDLTVAAYDQGNNAARSVTVGADNKYTLDVRPGRYRVQVMYTGGGNYATAWARAGSPGAWIINTASWVTVARGKTTVVPKVTIKSGHVVTGTVVDRSGRAVRDVDITAIAVYGSAREVVALTRSGANGTFTMPGLATGSYWFRAVYSGDGFRIESTNLTVNRGKGLRVTLDNASFRSHYKAYINGTRRVGKTVNVTATPWLAGSFPTTRASMSFQWKRNGKAIKGATGRNYRLGGADRGKTITVTATARRYGYNTGSSTSKGARIS